MYFNKTTELPVEMNTKTITLSATYLIQVYAGLLELDSEAFCQSTLVLLNCLSDPAVKGTGRSKISTKQKTTEKILKVDFMRSAEAQGSPVKSEEAAEILQSIVDMLHLDPNSPESKAKVVRARKLTLFLTLELWRLVVKSAVHVHNHVIQRGMESARQLIHGQKGKLPPPSEKALLSFREEISKTSSEYQAVIAMFGHFCTNRELMKIHGGFLKAGCLMALMENGLGLISWTIQAATSVGKDPFDFVRIVADDSVEKSARKFLEFFAKRQHDSWPVSRLLEDTAFKTYSTHGNDLWCLMCAYLVLKDAHILIPRIPQFSRSQNVYEQARLYAEDIRAMLRDPTQSIPLFAEGMRLKNVRIQRSRFREEMNREPPLIPTWGEEMREAIPQADRAPDQDADARTVLTDER